MGVVARATDGKLGANGVVFQPGFDGTAPGPPNPEKSIIVFVDTESTRLKNTAGNVTCQALVFFIPLHSALVIPSVGIFYSSAFNHQSIINQSINDQSINHQSNNHQSINQDDWARTQGPGPGPRAQGAGARGPMTGPGPRGPGPHTGPWAPRLGPLGPGPGPWAGAQSSIHPSIHLFLYVSMVNTVYTVYMVYMVYMASMVYTALFCKPHPGLRFV